MEDAPDPVADRLTVTPEYFRQIMQRLGPWSPDAAGAAPVALAVSGGGDSMALAWLSSQWRKNLIAFVVDHGLRPESGTEADQTLATLAKLKIPARKLMLTDLAHGSRLAERARMARYEALNRACEEAGCLSLLLGHQADDQAETVAMRRLRGARAGLSGMAWVTETPSVCLVRPLLGVSRAALRETLRWQGIPWCDDPSNENRAAERVRVRQELSGAERTDLLHLAAQAGAARQADDQAVAEELAEKVVFSPMGWVSFGQHSLRPDTMAALIRTVSGAWYQPPLEKVRQLMEAGREGCLWGVRLVRTRFRPGGSVEWGLVRELAATEGLLPAQDGAVWDGRFLFTAGRAGISSEWQTGAAGYGMTREERGGLPAVLCATLPALWCRRERMSVPHLCLYAGKEPDGAGFRFCPRNPVTVAAVRGVLPV